MLEIVSLIIVGLSVFFSTYLSGGKVNLFSKAQDGQISFLASCSNLTIEKDGIETEEIAVGQEAIIQAQTNNFNIVRYGLVENKGDRLSKSTNPLSLGQDGVFIPYEPGIYVFEVNAYESSDCNNFCSAGSSLYERKPEYQDYDGEDKCIKSGIWQLSGKCLSENCIKWLTVLPSLSVQIDNSEVVSPAEELIQANEPTITPTTPARIPMFSTQSTKITALSDSSDCYYIPSFLYGASSEEWDKYECLGGSWKVKSGLSAVLTSNEDLQMENIQAPSIKNFTSSVQTGDALVSYPIELPPAAGGFSPSVSLGYSSGAVEDMKVGIANNVNDWQTVFKNEFKKQGSFVGLGWNLSGIPQIIKNSAGKYNLVLGGQSYEVFLDEEKSGGSGEEYGGKSAFKKSYYKTVPESFLKIVRPEVTENEAKFGYEWDIRPWDIQTKEGTTYHFEKQGYFVNREHFFDQPCSDNFNFKNRKDYYKWAIVWSKDVSNNKIEYAYDPSETKQIEGDCGHCGDCRGFGVGATNPSYPTVIYPTEIKYGKNLQNKIVFNYEGLESKYWQIEKYDDSKKINFYSQKRLANIEVFLGANKLRSYEIKPSFQEKYLMLSSIVLKDGSNTPFPIAQNYEYYSKNDQTPFLLSKANNGYGGTVQYYFEPSEGINPNFSDSYYQYTGPDHTFLRNRLKYVVTKSEFNTKQKQKTEYFYPSFSKNPANDSQYNNDQDPYCKSDNGNKCYNAHATMKNPHWVDFEFLGYHFVKETNYFTETGADDTAQNNWLKDLSSFYVFNQGTQSADSKKFTPSLYKGTLAKKIVLNKDNQPLSLSESNYQESGGSHSYVYLGESKSCSDLDITDSSLRRGVYTKSEPGDFDNYANQIIQKTYQVGSCSATPSDVYKMETKINNNPLVYRITKTMYSNIDSENSYLIGKPVSIEAQDNTNKPLSLSLIKYDTKGRPIETLNIDGTKLVNKGGNVKAIVSRISYDEFGNIKSTTAYADYASGILSNNGSWNYQINSGLQDGRTTTIDYDALFSAFPKKQTNPLGYTTQTIYDFEEKEAVNVLGLPIKTIDARGMITQNVYDSFGRVLKTVSPDNRDFLTEPTVKFEYFDNQTSQTKVPFAVKVSKKDRIEDGKSIYLDNWVFYDDLGKKLQTQSQGTESKVFVDKTIYDALGRTISSISNQEFSGITLGVYQKDLDEKFISKINYDDQGRVVRQVNPDGTCSLTKYDGRQTTSFDAQKAKAVAEIDTLGRQSLIYSYQNPYSQVLGVSTVSQNFKQSMTAILDKIVSFFSKLTRGESPFGRLLNTQDLCRSASVTYPDVDVIYPLYTTSEQEYDFLDRPKVSTISLAVGKSLAQSSIFYDGFGRVEKSIDPDLGTTTIKEYDALGNQKVVKDNSENIKSFAYDKLGRVTETFLNGVLQGKMTYGNKVDPPNSGTGMLISQETPNVLKEEYKYDNLGRIYSSSYRLLDNSADSFLKAPVEYFTFYDVAGRPITQTVGLRDSDQPLANGFLDDIRYTYDSIGRFSGVRFGHEEGDNPNNNEYSVANIKYNSFGQPTEQTLANNTKETFSYDESGKSLRLKEHKVTKTDNNSKIFSINYQNYDNVGNILKLQEEINANPVSYSYSYDSFYRLAGVSGAINTSYAYDELSRMTVKNEKENLSFGFDSQTPLHAPKNYTLSGQFKDLNNEYDNSGNLKTLVNGNKLAYDQNNRITEVKNSHNKILSQFTYDFSGQRIKTTENGKTTYYHLPGIEIEKEGQKITFRRYLGSGAMQEIAYNSNPSDKNAMAISDEIYQTYTDHLGSVKLITNKDGQTINGGKVNYFPYGEQQSEGNLGDLSVSRFYTGQINDVSTGLYYYNARYYDPILGIFTSADQIQGPNRYSYVGGNPIMKNDPSGNDGEIASLSLKRDTLNGSFGGYKNSGYLDTNTLSSSEYQRFEEKIYRDVSSILESGDFGVSSEVFDFYKDRLNNEELQQLKTIIALTKSINNNVIYNQSSKDNQLSEPGLRKLLGGVISDLSNLNSDTLKVIMNDKGVCRHFSFLENYLLGKEGIYSTDLSGSGGNIFGARHSYLQVAINDKYSVIADPTSGGVFVPNDYEKRYGYKPEGGGITGYYSANEIRLNSFSLYSENVPESPFITSELLKRTFPQQINN